MNGAFHTSPARVWWGAHWSNAGVAAVNGENYPALTLEWQRGNFTINTATYSASVPLFIVPPGFNYSLSGIFQLTDKSGAANGDTFAAYIKHATDGAQSQSFLNVAIFQLTNGTALSSVNYSITNPTHALAGEIITQASPFYSYSAAGGPVIALHYELNMWAFV